MSMLLSAARKLAWNYVKHNEVHPSKHQETKTLLLNPATRTPRKPKISQIRCIFLSGTIKYVGDRSSTVVKVLWYKLEGR